MGQPGINQQAMPLGGPPLSGPPAQPAQPTQPTQPTQSAQPAQPAQADPAEVNKCLESCRESCTKKKEPFDNTDNCNIYIIAIIIISAFFLYDKYYKK